MKNITISIIGTGALGSALAKALHANGISVFSLFNRSDASLNMLTEIIHPKIIGDFPSILSELGDLIVITTPDQQISTIAEDLAKLDSDFSNKTVVHCSGTESSECLLPLKDKGAAVASFHPVQTFARGAGPEDFRGIYFDIEGNKKAIILLSKISKKLGAHTIKIPSHSKPYLHAAAVMASNYLVTLLEVSTEIAGMGDIDKKKTQKILMPLVQQSLENSVNADRFSEVLSGPIARSDIATVAAHLKLLEQKPEVLRLYKELGYKTMELADSADRIIPENKKQLEELLEN